MITLNVDAAELYRAIRWSDAHTKQLPFSAAQALNAAVQGSKFISGSKEKSSLAVLEKAAERYLDRPKPQTAAGWRATVANKKQIISRITPKDRPWKRTRYLSGNIRGGISRPKWDLAFVNHPSNQGIPAGSRLVPTRYWKGEGKLDKYGNIKKTDIKKLLNQVGTTGRTATGNIFIGKPRGGDRYPGVYRRERTHVLRPLLKAVDSVSYRAIFPAEKEINQTIQRHFTRYLKLQTLRNVKREAQRG